MENRLRNIWLRNNPDIREYHLVTSGLIAGPLISLAGIYGIVTGFKTPHSVGEFITYSTVSFIFNLPFILPEVATGGACAVAYSSYQRHKEQERSKMLPLDKLMDDKGVPLNEQNISDLLKQKSVVYRNEVLLKISNTNTNFTINADLASYVDALRSNPIQSLPKNLWEKSKLYRHDMLGGLETLGIIAFLPQEKFTKGPNYDKTVILGVRDKSVQSKTTMEQPGYIPAQEILDTPWI